MKREQLKASVVAAREAGIQPKRFDVLVQNIDDTRVQADEVRAGMTALDEKEKALEQEIVNVRKQWIEACKVERAAQTQAYIAEGDYCEAVSKEVIAAHPGVSQNDFVLDVQNAANSKLTFGLQVVGFLERSLRDGGREMCMLLDVIAETEGRSYRRMTNAQRERVAAVIERSCPKFPGTDRYLPPYLVDAYV